MLSNIEISAIVQTIVDKAKATAHVDQGTLKRSIQGKMSGGKAIFRQMYYGQYGENSQLEELARKLMPNGVSYNIISEDIDGTIYEKGKTKQGRATQSKSVAIAKRNTTDKIRALITKVQEEKKKDGKKKK